MRNLQLDGLRAVAVFAVVLSHTWLREAGIGGFAVRFFFVLSGFLITRILLGLEDRPGLSNGTKLRDFYIKRSLRIFPPYYLLLAAAFAVNLANARETWAWHTLYASNILFAIRDSWEPWVFAHLWSLSVEEQFYLVWPLIVLAAPRRHLVSICWIAIMISVFTRFTASSLTSEESIIPFVIPPASWDALAVGALLAIGKPGRIAGIFAGARPVAVYLIVLFVAISPALMTMDVPRAVWIELTQLPALYVFALLVWMANRNALPALLGTRTIAGLGRISYGIYLYHFPVVAIYLRLIEQVHFLKAGTFQEFVIVSAVTCAIAWPSWLLFEKPIQVAGRQLAGRSGLLAPV